jgi:uncharacterized protein (TIGR03067 family)
MRGPCVFILLAVLVIASCSKKPDRAARLEKSNGGTTEDQKAPADVDVKQPYSPEVEKELKQLEGVWNQVATEMDGKKRDVPPDDDFMSILIFKGDERIDKTKGDKSDRLTQFGKIRIDPTKTPKRIVFFVSGTKRITKEVYEIQGDELKICSILGSDSFPGEITGKKPQHLLVIYKRVKK